MKTVYSVLVALVIVLACTVPFKDRGTVKADDYSMMDENGKEYAVTSDKQLAETADSYSVKDEGTYIVEGLEEHGFVQESKEGKEYVLVNVKDRTDFVIFTDVYDEMRTGDLFRLELDGVNVLDYENVYMND